MPSGFPAGFQTLGGAVTWLGGAAAVGIGAIFCTFGYVATLSNLSMLGLEREPVSFHYDFIFYLQRGANFFLQAVEAIWVSLILAISLVLVILFALLGLRLLYQRSRLAMRQPFRRFTGRYGTWQAIAYAGLLLLLALQLWQVLAYQEWMAVSGILHGAVDEGSAGGSIREWILSGNELLLRDEFTYLANQQVWIGALLFFAWRVSRARRWRVLMTAPFALVFLVYTFSVAYGFGRLALPITFREALIPVEHSAQTAGASSVKMYLLRQSESGYVVWDPRHRQTREIPINTQVDLSEYRTLRQILTSSGAER